MTTSSTPSLSRKEFIASSAAVIAAASLPNLLKAQTNGKVVIGFVGLAHIHTPNYTKILKNHPDVIIKSVYDYNKERSKKYSELLGAKSVDSDDAIWSDPQITAVVILSETNLHHTLVSKGAQAGKHMFVEKPLGINTRESLEMAAAINKAGVLFTTGYFNRVDPKHIFIKNEVAKGNFGTVTRVRASNCHAGSLNHWFDKDYRWMADPSIAGVGAFGDLGTHKLDILMWIFGDIEMVSAAIKPIVHNYGDCDESGEALIKFKNGITGTLAAGWVDVDDPVGFLVSGTEAHAVVFNGNLYYKNKKLGLDGKKPITEFPKTPLAPINQFIAAVLGSKDQPLVKPSEAAARVSAMEAMYTASQANSWVNVV
jgi:predicted dehydrogenase